MALFEEDSRSASDSTEEKISVNTMVNEVVTYATSPENVARLNAVERDLNLKEGYFKEIREYISERYELGREAALIEEVIEGFCRFMWSYYIIDELIEDKSISDIRILAYDRIFVKKNGVRRLSHVKFADEKEYERFVERVAIKNKINLSDKNAIQVFSDNTQPGWRLRFNISTKFLTNTGVPYIHIRKHPAKKYNIDDLIEVQMLSEPQAEYLKGKMQKGESILFCGSGGSGKTTLLNALIEYIPDKSIYCIQESDELFMEKKAEFMSYHTVENKGEGKINYALSDLAKNGLLTDTDVFMVGEIKGDEALDFLIAVHTGATGYGSVHAPSEEDAFIRLVDYIKKSSDYSAREIQYMLRFLKTVVFMKGYKVDSISSVDWDREKDKLMLKKEEL